MMEEVMCQGCQQQFLMDEGELHPTKDGIVCPHCGAETLFTVAYPTWESWRERVHDDRWEAHHEWEEDEA